MTDLNALPHNAYISSYNIYTFQYCVKSGVSAAYAATSSTSIVQCPNSRATYSIPVGLDDEATEAETLLAALVEADEIIKLYALNSPFLVRA